MPRIFSESDRDAIRCSLLAVGREHFLRYGLRKTSVDQLATAVGIAKGTFYSFFSSKEELCLEIYDQEESEMGSALAKILSENDDPAEAVRALLRFSVDFVRGDSLLAALRETGDYALLAHSATGGDLVRHQAHDLLFADRLLDALRGKGAEPILLPEEVAALLRAYVLLTFHEAEIGKEIFPRIMELLGEWIGEKIARKGEDDGKVDYEA